MFLKPEEIWRVLLFLDLTKAPSAFRQYNSSINETIVYSEGPIDSTCLKPLVLRETIDKENINKEKEKKVSSNLQPVEKKSAVT